MHSKDPIYDSLYKEAIQQGWSGWGGNNRIAKQSEQVKRILSFPYIPRSGKLLELGCGEGSVCRLFAQQGYDVTGIDISAVAIRRANEKNITHGTKIKYYHGDFASKNFQTIDQFDLIIDGNCLHCILDNNRLIFLKNVHTNLCGNGIFFISSLCSKDNQDHIIFHNKEPYRFIPAYVNLTNEIYNAGFVILDQLTHKRDKYNHINLFCKKV